MDLSKHLENAAEAVKRRNYPFAIKVYGQLLAIQPDNYDARFGLRQALFKKVAQKPASKFGAILGGGVNLLIAGVCRMLGRHAAAANAYERYLVHDPLSEGANLKLAVALQRTGYRHAALAVFRAYAEAEPRCLPAARSAGALLYEEGKLQDALSMYEQALKVDPRDQESLKARKDLAAEGALRSSGIEQAKSSRELIKDKEQQQKLERQDRMHFTQEEIGTELGQLEEQLQENPDDIKLLRRVARLREMAKDLQGALDCLEHAARIGTPDSELLDVLGELRLRLQEQIVQKTEAGGDRAAARQARQALAEARVAESRRRMERNPSDLAQRFQLGAALLDLGDTDASIAELQQAVKDPRKKVEALFLLGRAFQRKALPELALAQFEKALAGAGNGVLAKDALYEMGEICRELGKADLALKHFSRILEQDIGFRDVAQKVEQLKAS
jgi:tetratricopeptide (TPR) repeat protein